MTRILLVRHGESEWNAAKRWQGRADPELSQAGRDQASQAAQSLQGFSGWLVASPLRRARTTADILAAALGIATIETIPDLVEVDVGGWSGLTHAEIQERFPDDWQARQDGTMERFPGGEALADFRRRCLHGLRTIASMYEGEVVAVTHGGVIGAIERELDVHPGTGVSNLGGRWFTVDGDAVTPDGERVSLLDVSPTGLPVPQDRL